MLTVEILVSAALGLATVLAVCTGLVVRFKSPQPRQREESENYFLCIDEKHERQRLGSLSDEPTVDLSIIVPAYNEEERLPVLLKDIREYVTARRQSEPKFSYELIIMDDGSRDKTVDVAMDFARTHKMRELKAVRHVINRGKGGAVTQGIMCSLGRYIMFCDADGATRFSDIDALLAQAKKSAIEGRVVAIGSRNNQALSDTVVERSHVRAFLQWGFHTYVTILGVRGVRDTQCGFKLFSREAARRIFPNMHVERFIFDVEILLLARYHHIPVVEVPVNWHEVAGSKMSIVRDSIQMALDLLAVRLNYMLGNWKVSQTAKD
ncbi:dolichyl-phosphate beta-glucosyltransferase [Coemansia sp. RSA 2523]|nr:dolichyl-phosphate beta-glucosyltransferase [Coemansia sp. RSA 1752]KAJ1776452.1 dolichyl-phosphate beta-glucosyltransferase [Coemansia sp. RSA 1824]KAJ1806705.1 dolichyl-phosphate beta-glucosyltransferase [Coemansia sp. RSA 2523]KAJ2132632.1 dolichyl-phosphate beta-glucosyltransferase [Coemansia sp. RSA 921]KAJ2253545.1 dolichyl-phosphate beta-glucosyltransferase [Coemansia sp. RSA 454]KAJ2428139.1 dolichyl-phosphate beta-glucosyltransferase [Coemansia sp. RSA 2524]KAJ2532638.1 dolichyl-p